MKSLLLLCLLVSPLSTAGLDEDTRMREYHKRGYKWPLEKMVPETPGWRRIMERRFEQVSSSLSQFVSIKIGFIVIFLTVM